MHNGVTATKLTVSSRRDIFIELVRLQDRRHILDLTVADTRRATCFKHHLSREGLEGIIQEGLSRGWVNFVGAEGD